MDQFSKVAKKYLDKGLIAGLEWEIRHFNKVLSKNVEGYSDIENKTILEPGQIYRIYSMTKPIVSVAAIRLIEACKLSLYSNIQDFIPSFKHLKVLRPNGELERLKRPINLADLLTHTSGLSYNFNMGCSVAQFYQQENILNDPNISLEQMVDQIATIPLAFQPGESWRYSVATDVIGRVLEVVVWGFQKLRIFSESATKKVIVDLVRTLIIPDLQTLITDGTQNPVYFPFRPFFGQIWAFK